MTINPTIFRLGITKDWCFKCVEKKANEFKTYVFKLNQIQNFLSIFFYHYGLKLHFIRLFYNNLNIHIFVTHTHSYRIRIIRKTKISKVLPYRSKNFVLKIINIIQLLKLIRFIKLKYFKTLSSYLAKDLNFKFYFSVKRQNLKVFKRYLKTKYQLKVFSNVCDFFLKKCLISLNNYLGNKTSVVLTIRHALKPNLNNYLLKKHKTNLCFNLLKLKKFEKKHFFKPIVNEFVKYLLSSYQNYSYNMLTFTQLFFEQFNNPKYLNILLSLIKNIIRHFFMKTSIIGLVMKIKGNLTKNPRATNKSIIVGKPIGCTKINSMVNFHEVVCYTKKGTLGFKISIL